MKGFDPKFPDLPAFILGITKEIWEDRGVEELWHYYAPEIPVRSPDGVTIGNEAVIDATYATLAEFPDRQLLGEDVIWSGNDLEGFFSSHRILSTATHTGEGLFGPPTGTRLRYRVIADCAAIDNQIYDEWIVRDLGAIVRQLGRDPKAFAAAQLDANAITGSGSGSGGGSRPLADQNEPSPRYQRRGNDDPIGIRYAEALRSVLTGDGTSMPEIYDRAVHVELPGGEAGHGWDDVDRFWGGLREAFPDATFAVHHRIGRDDPGLGPRAAVRWSLTGTHDGNGRFGPPTGAPVHVMGISHAEYGPWGLRREYIVLDEIAIWKQLLLHTG